MKTKVTDTRRSNNDSDALDATSVPTVNDT
jgi:hypothetical protein